MAKHKELPVYPDSKTQIGLHAISAVLELSWLLGHSLTTSLDCAALRILFSSIRGQTQSTGVYAHCFMLLWYHGQNEHKIDQTLMWLLLIDHCWGRQQKKQTLTCVGDVWKAYWYNFHILSDAPRAVNVEPKSYYKAGKSSHIKKTRRLSEGWGRIHGSSSNDSITRSRWFTHSGSRIKNFFLSRENELFQSNKPDSTNTH